MHGTKDPGHWREERWSLIRAPAVNTFNWTKRLSHRHRAVVILVLLFLLFVIFAERPYIQPLLLAIRIYGPGAAVVMIVTGAIVWILTRFSVRMQALGGLIAIGVSAVLVYFGPQWHHDLASYLRYRELRHEIVDLPKGQLYRTGLDRALPLAAVDGLIRDRTATNEHADGADYVRVGTQYRWTTAIEPSYWGRFAGDVTEFISIDASDMAPDLSRRVPWKVNFDVGENLLFSRNIDTCVRRSFGPLQMWNYQPGNVMRTINDTGRPVYVVSLIRWRGWFFPWPEFGGVQIIEESGPHGHLHNWTQEWPKHVILGCGHYIPPHDVVKHAFLRGQNIVPYEVSRFMALSNQYQSGFLGPTRLSKKGAIRIPDVPEDLNQQPYVLFARATGGDEGKLYQWFGLQPEGEGKCVLSISFLVPADGIGPSYRYNHVAHGESPIGPSCVADRVRAKKDDTYWANRRPAEAIPYIHEIEDANGNRAPRLTFKTVIVIQKVKEGEKHYIPAIPPETWIVDAYRELPVPVGHDPKKWDAKLQEELGSKWAEH